MSRPGNSGHSYLGSSIVPFRLVFLMWLVFTVQFFYGLDFSRFGVTPRTAWGLIGIFTAPLIHGNLAHIASNTIPLLFLGGTLFFFYNRIGATVFLRCYFIPNILVWLFAPHSNPHIGASGLVYALSAFLIFFGLLRKDIMSMLISIVVILLYGGIFYGILPTQPWISWESHLAGTIVGAATAIMLRHKKTV
jgi:membrane associated rhomboid family serine protease